MCFFEIKKKKGENVVSEENNLEENSLPDENSENEGKKSLFDKITDVLFNIFPIVVGFVVPVLNFYFLQGYITYDLKTNELVLLNIIFFELFGWFLAFLTRRIRTGMLIETIIVFIFGLAEYFVVQFRTTPILPWDIFSIGTAANVAGAYEFKMSKDAIKVTVYFCIIIAVLIGMMFLYRKKKLFKLKTTNIIAFVVSAVCLFGYSISLQSDKLMESADYYKYQYTPLTMMRKNGIAVTLLYDVKYMSVKKPDRYSKEEEKALLEKYADKKEDEDKPNVIAIMNETWSDLSVLEQSFETNEEVMPFVDSLKGADNTITGNCHVSIVGGNTANSEFEFITGDTMRFMPDGSIPYMNFIKKGTPSMFSHMESIGYETYFLHPNYERGWNRKKVYEAFGAENILFNDLDGDDDKMSVVQKRRGYTTDQYVFNKIEDIYKEKEDGKPIFTWAVTIQNHGGYTSDYDDFKPWIEVGGESSKALDTYLSLINLTDQSFKQLVDFFSSYDEKTVIVMFGDHQPNDSVVEPLYQMNGKSVYNLTPEETEKRYITPYVIWANYDIESASDVDTSANYLAAQTLKAAGVETSDYQNYLLDLAAEIPVLSNASLEDENGSSIEESDETERLEEYRKLAYYRLFDSQKNN